MAMNIARRKFLVAFGGTAFAWPLTARAQEARKLLIIGLLSLGASPTDPANFRPFLEQMRRQPLYDLDSQWARNFEAAADSVGVALEFVKADESNLDSAIAARPPAARRAWLSPRTAHHLPAIFVFRAQVEAGGLLAYAAKVPDLARRAAFFVDRILTLGKKIAESAL